MLLILVEYCSRVVCNDVSLICKMCYRRLVQYESEERSFNFEGLYLL